MHEVHNNIDKFFLVFAIKYATKTNIGGWSSMMLSSASRRGFAAASRQLFQVLFFSVVVLVLRVTVLILDLRVTVVVLPF